MRQVTDELNDMELDQMLLSLKDAPIPTPANEIRQSLQRLSAVSHDSNAPAFRSGIHPYWLRWAFATTACAAAIVGIGLRKMQRPHESVTSIASVVDRLGPDATQGAVCDLQHHVHSIHRVSSGAGKSSSHPRPHHVLSQLRSFTVELPYSNRDIANGTGTAVSVQVSREELMALGYPIDDVAGDHKYLAEIALGDDGLPRSIRIPLPLRSID
jgi:hypothetical protein